MTLNMKKKITTILILIFLMVYENQAQQQRQYSQYLYSLFAINPAYAGNRDFIQTLITERKQWTGVQGSPHTQSLMIHAPFNNRKMGLGLNIVNETIGAHGITGGMMSYSYSIVSPKSRLSFGLRGGGYSFRVMNDKLSYRDENDPSSLSNVQSNFTPVFDAGIHFHSGRFMAGAVVSNLVESNLKLINDNIVSGVLSRHMYLYTGYTFPINDVWSFRPSVFVKYVQNAPFNGDVNVSFVRNERISFGFSYRTSGSVIAMLQAYITENIRLGYAYDHFFNFSNFSGSHEVVLGIDFRKKNSGIMSPRYL